MKKFIFLGGVLIAIFLGPALRAQIWAPAGAQWYYDASHPMQSGYVHVEYIKDTLILDDEAGGLERQCAVLRKTRYYSNNGVQQKQLGNEYTYATDNAVYVYKRNAFYTLYNFAADIGDTWELPYNYYTGNDDCLLGQVMLTSKGDTLIDGEQLRYIRLARQDTYPWAIEGLVIEKIGPVQAYMLPEQNCVADLFEGSMLRCYADNKMSFSTGVASECDYLSVDDTQEEVAIQLYPNPCHNNLQLQLPGNMTYSCRIYDISGRELMHLPQLTQNANIDVHSLQAGTYFLKLCNTQTTSYSFIFIKH